MFKVDYKLKRRGLKDMEILQYICEKHLKELKGDKLVTIVKSEKLEKDCKCDLCRSIKW